MTITDLGWPRTVSISTDRTTTQAGSPYATLTVDLSQTLGGYSSPYKLFLWDETGKSVPYNCTNSDCTGTRSFRAPITLAPHESHTYTAYVALSKQPSSGVPTVDVKRSRSISKTMASSCAGVERSNVRLN